MAWLIGRFIEHFGPGTYHNPQRWPTRDGVVPFGVFLVLLDVIPALQAERQLMQALGHQLGQLLVENGKDFKVRTAVRRLSNQAYPRFHDDSAEGGE